MKISHQPKQNDTTQIAVGLPGLDAIKELLRESRHRPLTLDDGRAVDQEIKTCCAKHPVGCGRESECQLWDEKLAGHLPPDVEHETARQGPSEPGDWMRGKLHLDVRMRQPVY